MKLMIHILCGFNNLKTITIAKTPLNEFLQKHYTCMMHQCKLKYLLDRGHYKIHFCRRKQFKITYGFKDIPKLLKSHI